MAARVRDTWESRCRVIDARKKILLNVITCVVSILIWIISFRPTANLSTSTSRIPRDRSPTWEYSPTVFNRRCTVRVFSNRFLTPTLSHRPMMRLPCVVQDLERTRPTFVSRGKPIDRRNFFPSRNDPRHVYPSRSSSINRIWPPLTKLDRSYRFPNSYPRFFLVKRINTHSPTRRREIIFLISGKSDALKLSIHTSHNLFIFRDIRDNLVNALRLKIFPFSS